MSLGKPVGGIFQFNGSYRRVQATVRNATPGKAEQDTESKTVSNVLS